MGIKQWIVIAVVAILAKSFLEYYLQPKLQGVVHGHCDPRFQKVADAFRKNVESGFEPGAAISVYHNGARVVDLWGGYADPAAQRPWNENTLSLAFSAGKGLAAIVVAMLVERGYLDYKAPVTQYWPEFGQKDKDNITVEMLLSHQAGLVILDTHFELSDLLNNRDTVEEVLASQGTIWPAGSQIGYHAVTFGMYVDTLVKKVDPKGRTTSQIFLQDIAAPHGIDLYMTTPKDQFHRTARLTIQSKWEMLLETLFSPKYFPILGYFILFPNSLTAKCGSAIKDFREDLNVLNNPDIRETELSSSMATGTARGLAKLYGILSTDGVDLETNERLLAPETVRALSTPVYSGQDVVLQKLNTYGPGTNVKESPEGSLSVFGHTGHGGQVGLADKNRKLGIGYLTNYISIYGMGDDPRYVKLEEAIYESVKKLED